MRRFVTLGNGHRVPLAAYTAGWRAVLSDPPGREYAHGLTGWWSRTAAEVLAEYRAGLHDRINRHDPAYGRGRKWDDDWQRHAEQDAERIRRASVGRLLVRRTEIGTDDWRERFAHLWEDESC